MKAQSSGVQKVKVLVEQLQAEKVSLGSVVEAGRVSEGIMRPSSLVDESFV